MNAERSSIRVRFAPSPNGYMHPGHAYSALKNYALAQLHGGTMLLRIEDIDLGRSQPAFEAAVFEDLAWLGLHWVEPVRRQSQHFDHYRKALAKLVQLGVTYRCFCTRGEIARSVARNPTWPRDPDGEPLYPGTCRGLPDTAVAERLACGDAASWRLNMQQALALCPMALVWEEFGEAEVPRTISANPAAWGDAVVARKEVPTSYTLAVVTDDALQGITDVVRGEDLFAATHLQRLLQVLLGLPAPRYRHHALVRDATGAKLSKRLASTSLRTLREAGIRPEDLRRQLGFV